MQTKNEHWFRYYSITKIISARKKQWGPLFAHPSWFGRIPAHPFHLANKYNTILTHFELLSVDDSKHAIHVEALITYRIQHFEELGPDFLQMFGRHVWETQGQNDAKLLGHMKVNVCGGPIVMK